jgi:hypothetical protein
MGCDCPKTLAGMEGPTFHDGLQPADVKGFWRQFRQDHDIDARKSGWRYETGFWREE